MSDKYLQFANTALGSKLCGLLGLSVPVPLQREDPASPHRLAGNVLLAAAGDGAFADAAQSVLAHTGMTLVSTDDDERCDALVFDASGIATAQQSRQLYDFFHTSLARLRRHGRIVVIGRTPSTCGDADAAAVQRGLTGFVKSLAREVGRRGATANLLVVDADASAQLEAPLRFFLSRGSAFVDGQSLTVHADATAPSAAWDRPLVGKVALVTGAARGIGLATCNALARDGARVIGIDVPQAGDALQQAMQALDGIALPLDISATDAPERLLQACREQAGTIDIVVHNAGILRDRMLRRMATKQWEHLVQVNLAAIMRVNAALLATDLLDNGGRIICVSSISGIAGNAGQTNYAFAKAGVIGIVEALAATCRERGITINAVAPGFIETDMTATIPLVMRQFGRRLSSLSQGGQPADIAEVIAFFASPQANGVNGTTLRACGQSLIGA